MEKQSQIGIIIKANPFITIQSVINFELIKLSKVAVTIKINMLTIIWQK